MATLTVRGELEPSTFPRLRDRLMWVAENCPRRLVLDLDISDRFAEQLIDAIAATRRQLPVDCLLVVRPVSPAVCHLLKLAGLPGVRVTTARHGAERAQLGGPGQGS